MIRIETDARGIAQLTLATPDRHNVLSAEMIGALDEAADRLGADPAVRVVVLQAEGDSFCAGGDLGWMRAQMAADARARRAAAQALAGMLGKLNRLPKPLIGRIHGAAYGGGVGLACVCDVAIAAEGARFGLTETRLGLIPATIGPYVVARMGEAASRQVFYSGRRFGAEEAARLGIVARVVAPEDLDAAVEAEATPYLDCAPGAVAAAKALALRLGGAAGQEEIDASVEALVAQWEGAEAPEGIAAFFERRKPSWAPE